MRRLALMCLATLSLSAAEAAAAAPKKQVVNALGVAYRWGGAQMEPVGHLFRANKQLVFEIHRDDSPNATKSKYAEADASPMVQFPVVRVAPAKRSAPVVLWWDGPGTAYYGNALHYGSGKDGGLAGLSRRLDAEKHPIAQLGKHPRGTVLSLPIESREFEITIRRTDGAPIGKDHASGVRGNSIAAVKREAWATADRETFYGAPSFGYVTDARGNQRVLLQLSKLASAGEYEIFVQHHAVAGKGLTYEQFHSYDFQRYRVTID